MNNDYFVSVVIPTYNRAYYLRRAVDSVLNQTYTNFELIIVDDGSKDSTEKLIKSYGNSMRYFHQKNSGVSSARNKGIAFSRGRYLSFLDSDDEWKPDKLAIQIDFFMKNRDALICQTEEVWIRNDFYLNPQRKHKKYSGIIFEKCLPLCIISPSAVMIDKKVFKKIGLFDESFPACEDYDLWLRISSLYPVYLIKQKLVVKYGGHFDQLSKNAGTLDLFRIKAIVKILNASEVALEDKKAAFLELIKKCKIYGNGCLKRGKNEEGNLYLNLPERYKWCIA